MELNTEKEETREAIRTHLWDEETHFFYDLNQQMEKIRIKTAAAFWTIIAGVADDYQTEWLCNYLEDEKTFNRLHRVPSLAADEEAFDPKGNYWNGSVWAPLNAMIVTGLEDKGKHELARNIALNDTSCIADIFKSTGTIWENYPADYLDQGYSDHPDMVGWSGMAPILFFIKYGVGLSPAADGSLNWDLRFLDNAEIVACSNYWWMGKTASLKAEKKDGKVAIITGGYGDGISRALSNKGQVLIHGVRCPILGRVTMDQTIVDVSEVPDVRPGDEVVLIGSQGGETISLAEFSKWADTIPWETLCSVTKRVPRRYKTALGL